MNIPLMTITIDIDPNMFEIGPFLLTWHGFFTFLGVALAVYLVGRWSKKEGLATDPIYTVASWAILGGILGARAAHVIDRWDDFYSHNPLEIIQIWEGGIAIWGGVLGGFLGGAGYMFIRNHPRFLSTWNNLFKKANLQKADLPSIGKLADITAPALLAAMALGRVGDIINGEHIAGYTFLPWAVTYDHPDSPATGLPGATHPAVVYEMLFVLATLGIIWLLKDRLRPHGMLFTSFLAIYSLGKFFLSFLRVGNNPLTDPTGMDREWFLGLGEAHVIAVIVLAITVPLLMYKVQLVRPASSTRIRGARTGRRR